MKKITKKSIKDAFGELDFGIPKRKYLAKLLCGIAAGYGVGQPQASILLKLKLINKKRRLTKRGRLFISDYFKSNM